VILVVMRILRRIVCPTALCSSCVSDCKKGSEYPGNGWADALVRD
jgi:hypothetical protein